MPNIDSLQQEIDRNYEAFEKLLPELLLSQADKYALMKAGKILGFYSSSGDAREAAESFIQDKLYSIQKVTDTAVDLGYFSHAVHRVPV